jgi:hypothetical protein
VVVEVIGTLLVVLVALLEEQDVIKLHQPLEQLVRVMLVVYQLLLIKITLLVVEAVLVQLAEMLRQDQDFQVALVVLDCNRLLQAHQLIMLVVEVVVHLTLAVQLRALVD